MRRQFKFDLRLMLRASLCAAICMIWLGVPATAQRPTIITFDAPGAAGTTPYSISSTGAVTGTYWDASGVSHAFVRAPDGAITNFDYPGATFTMAWAIGPSGEITGLYGDPTVANWDHGFLRTPDGKFHTFDAPDAGNGTGCCGSLGSSNAQAKAPWATPLTKRGGSRETTWTRTT